MPGAVAGTLLTRAASPGGPVPVWLTTPERLLLIALAAVAVGAAGLGRAIRSAARRAAG